MDGVTILNEIEVVQVMNDTFNNTAGAIAFIITVLMVTLGGFLIGGIDYSELDGALIGLLVGTIVGVFISMPVFGYIFRNPSETKTSVRYEVIVDDSVSLTEFYEHYSIIEQRGQIFIVEEKCYE